ncbi:MAG: hypothetical protein COT85_00995 [Chlamydiae bacterium CG10_big_fil_rev_8_21_14_0_10_42_34]|nr:MAG: hypothetical protein COT85_00995 [Chlamydiae bacterium CG10_big_fil_rev_8_21_14_0_10_42_34]
MRLCWILLLLCPLLCAADNEEEALFLRRIADFWQEGEYQIAKSQMEEFIIDYPESPYSDALCAALGDLFLREKNFTSALDYYSKVQTPEFFRRVFLNRMKCLYEMQWHATLADECESYLEDEANLHVTYFLAIALYQQCLNAPKDSEQLSALAQRAKPHFETLSQSELSNEIAQGYAHICYLLKDYERASKIYLDVAEKDPTAEEEMLFQVALIQSEFDKNLAMQTFDKIAKLKQTKSKEAAYNRLVLAYDLGLFEELTDENLLNDVPEDRMAAARLFLGRSLVNLKKYDKAISELKAVVVNAPISETLHAALLSLLDASYQASDLASLDQAIAKLSATYPKDPELPKAYFSRAQILKKDQDIASAKEQLENLLAQFPEFDQKPQVIFELTHLDYKAKEWASCHKRAADYLAEFSNHELAPFAWRYYISSSVELAEQNPQLKEQLIADLKTFLTLPLAESEKTEWEIILAKSFFEMEKYDEAYTLAESIDAPNAKLLLALCFRDGYKDTQNFCEIAEKALSDGANLIDPGQIHASLFNGYLELSDLQNAAEHLYAAFQAKADIKRDNLLWLADLYLNRLEEETTNFSLAHRTALILDKCKLASSSNEDLAVQTPNDETALEAPLATCKAALHDEAVVCKLAKVYSILGRTDDEITILEALPDRGIEAELLLAESYARKGIVEKATEMFENIVTSSATVRNRVSASASLQGARLKLASENPDLTKIAAQLKTLVVQKNFEGEPLYLEAALDYVDVQAKNDAKKRVSLLEKTKLDFVRRDDLLSKDYHEARARWPQKDKIYQGYLQLIDAEILAAKARLEDLNEKDLRAKSKALLLHIANEQTATALLERARMLLINIDETKAEE